MNRITKKIAEGVTFDCIPTDRFKTTVVTVFFEVPLVPETASLHTLLPLVLLRGCKDYPSQAELNRRMEYLYSAEIDDVNYRTGGVRVLGFDLSILDEKYVPDVPAFLSDCAGLLRDILFSPYLPNGTFDHEYVESEKRSLIEEIRQLRDNKSRYAMNRCLEIACGEDPFGYPSYGTEDDVNAVDADALLKTYHDLLANYPVHIYYSGRGDGAAVEAIFTEAFGKIARHPISVDACAPIPATETVRRAEESEEINQGRLAMLFRTETMLPDADYPALILFDEIFGAGTTSKLFMNVREKMSLCYSCSSRNFALKNMLTVSAGIDSANRETAERAILDQLEAIRRGEISDWEWDSAHRSLENAYRSTLDSPYSIITYVHTGTLVGVERDPEHTMEKICRVTREDVSRIAGEISLHTVFFLKGEISDGSVDLD